MAATATISAEQYFQLSFPEREAELDHGVISERPLPDFLHSYIQSELILLLRLLLRTKTEYSVCPELRMRVSKDVVRILDICVLDYRPDTDTAPAKPPLVAIEVVSKDDRYTEILKKLREYHEWGVPHVWLIDPRSEQLGVYGPKGFMQVEALTLPQFNFSVTLKQLLPPE